MVAMNQGKAQEIDSSETLPSMSDHDMTSICDVIMRLGCLVSGGMSARGVRFLSWWLKPQACCTCFQDNG